MTTDLLVARLEVEMRAFRPLTAKSPHQLVAEQFRQHMSLGWWPAGFQLPPERELASELNVSRETVRQAVRLLTDEGRVIPRGPRMAPAVAASRSDRTERRRELTTHRKQFADLQALRELLETHTAKQAASARRKEHLALMTRAQGNLRTAVEMDSRDAFRAADTDFHLAVAAASGNAALREEVRRIRCEMFLALDELVEGRELNNSADEHQEILEAIRNRSEDEAMKRMGEHLSHTQSRLNWLLTNP